MHTYDTCTVTTYFLTIGAATAEHSEEVAD